MFENAKMGVCCQPSGQRPTRNILRCQKDSCYSGKADVMFVRNLLYKK